MPSSLGSKPLLDEPNPSSEPTCRSAAHGAAAALSLGGGIPHRCRGCSNVLVFQCVLNISQHQLLGVVVICCSHMFSLLKHLFLDVSDTFLDLFGFRWETEEPFGTGLSAAFTANAKGLVEAHKVIPPVTQELCWPPRGGTWQNMAEHGRTPFSLRRLNRPCL